MKKELAYTLALSLFLSFLAASSSYLAGPGTDDMAKYTILNLSGGSYQPWIKPLWDPGESQGLFFGLQAGFGGAALGYFLFRQNKGGD